MIKLAGGWGYDNLGDEAILAGYLEFLLPEYPTVVASVDPARTAHAQRIKVEVVKEGWSRSSPEVLLLGGGGYLNGGWVPQIYPKLGRLGWQAAFADVIAHGIEVRAIHGFVQESLARRIFDESKIAVRDAESADTLNRLYSAEATILPDAISLLIPHLHKYVTAVDQAQGRVIVNLLDLTTRPDSLESLIDNSKWLEFCEQLLGALGDRALGIAVGAYDIEFMRRWPRLEIVTPRSVTDLVSLLESADATFSVRMHPALIASGLGKPVVSVPYCGKVLPTLRRIGVEDAVIPELRIDDVLERLAVSVNSKEKWDSAFAENAQWLRHALSSVYEHSGTCRG